MTSRIPYRIDIFFIEMLICVLLCEHGIACTLRWRVALVGVILIGHCSPHRGTPLLGAGYVHAANTHSGLYV